ncbi:hypothetical protein UFOVP150_38 [uncultured Caudovirales phage]|uniref:Uncharacterized protein n=1 Tax=uncultured Caudovirales phage TaxID=2100421 RepID=A0A6J7WA41_9CAUD|nr:hypothetical protein UFOVP150_38 [uncultured Caudovirales phage]
MSGKFPEPPMSAVEAYDLTMSKFYTDHDKLCIETINYVNNRIKELSLEGEIGIVVGLYDDHAAEEVAKHYSNFGYTTEVTVSHDDDRLFEIDISWDLGGVQH